MKIAVTASRPDATASVDPRFGRGAFYMVYDTDAATWQALENTQGRAASHGAGVRAAEQIAASGAAVLLTGSCGPRAFQVLTEAGIKVCTGVTGSVTEAVQRFLRGEIAPASGPDRDGPW
ncbi:MAG: NifB/NifX family molybdenum-iron cluster-binding protein [Chthonomonadales bacterium]